MYSCVGFYFITLSLIINHVSGNYEFYECPTGWEDFDQYCYRFRRSELLTVIGAKESCAVDGAHLLTVNSDQEHSFILQQLDAYDSGQQKKDWWTSGRRQSEEKLQFYWEGDGKEIESYFYWHNDSVPQDLTKDFIMYNFNGYNWGWIVGKGSEISPYVCKISKEDIFKIQDYERGPDYGNPDPDPENVDRGPVFLQQPINTVHEPVVTSSVASDIVTLECIAEGVPEPEYEWYKQRGTENVKLDAEYDHRYTFINGRLVIDEPSAEREDDGRYQCGAFNTYGKILSNQVELAFGFLQDFPKSPRSPVTATEYQWASIECNPPKHYPDDLHYTWYKNIPSNFVRTELKPYIFISKDSRLYFSEVTSDDNGQYYCVAQKPGITWSSGVESMPTELKVISGSPGEYDPEVGSGFPNVWPKNPKVGDTIWLECWASGTSQPALNYFWDKVELDDFGDIVRVLDLPNQAKMVDHNRVVQIPNVQLYDGGVYRCRVDRTNGGSTHATVQVMLQAEPYWVVDLKDQFVDEGADLAWRCEAGGVPGVTYTWLKNGLTLAEQILPEDADRVKITNNVLTIKTLNAEKDNGMHQCAASNTHGTRYSAAELRVLSFAPSFEKYPLQINQFATKDGNTTIMCRPEAAPTPDITWYKNGGNLNPGTDEGSRIRQMPNGNLFISPVYTTDEGVYRCQAVNVHGEASSTGNLTVLSTVTISLPPEANTISINKTLFLLCVASYNHQLDVTYYWYHNKRLIDFEIIYRLGENRYEIWRNPHYKRGTGIYNGGIYIMNAQYEHEGDYKCVVESTAGDQIERSAYIMIEGPPSEPAGVFLSSKDATETSNIIQWKAAGDNHRPILSYVIETQNHWENFWRIAFANVQVVPDATDNTDTLRFNVTGLRPYSKYTIRVRAENILGTSAPSQPSEEFWTDCIKPDLYPQEVGGGGGKVGELVITWKPLEPWEENCIGIGYRIYWKPLGDEEWGERIESVSGVHFRFVKTVGEDNFYKEYEVAVQAFNDEGDGPLSPISVIRSAMKIPNAQVSNVRAQPFNSTACLVTWIPVEDTREAVNGKLGGYRLAYWEHHLGVDYERSWRVTLNGQASEGLVIGLYPNTPYYFAVYVWNEAGNGPKSEHFQQRTLRNAPLNQPVEIEVQRLSDTSIHAFWRGFSTTQIEEPLEGYKVRLWREGEDIKNATDYNAGKDTDLIVQDLNPAILYKLRVFGWSRGGEGAMSFPTMKFLLGGSTNLQYSWCILLTFILSLWHNS